jgi:glycerophosphoryl diester phosphodiesterase
MKKTKTILSLQDANFRVFGHRGIMGVHDENTMDSFVAAKAAGFAGIEYDLQKTRDGKPVIIHDGKVDRTTNGKGWVKELLWKKIRTMRTEHGYTIPTFEEVLALSSHGFVQNIELKSRGSSDIAVKILKEGFAKKILDPENFIVSSFHHRDLVNFKKHIKNVRIGALIAHWPADGIAFAKKIGAWSINVDIDIVNEDPSIVEETHKAGLKIGVWTIRSYDDAKRMKDLGVDFIFSNFP